MNLLTTAEVARRLGRTSQTVRTWIKTGLLPAQGVTGESSAVVVYLVSEADVEAFTPPARGCPVGSRMGKTIKRRETT